MFCLSSPQDFLAESLAKLYSGLTFIPLGPEGAPADGIDTLGFDSLEFPLTNSKTSSARVLWRPPIYELPSPALGARVNYEEEEWRAYWSGLLAAWPGDVMNRPDPRRVLSGFDRTAYGHDLIRSAGLRVPDIIVSSNSQFFLKSQHDCYRLRSSRGQTSVASRDGLGEELVNMLAHGPVSALCHPEGNQVTATVVGERCIYHSPPPSGLEKLTESLRVLCQGLHLNLLTIDLIWVSQDEVYVVAANEYPYLYPQKLRHSDLAAISAIKDWLSV